MDALDCDRPDRVVLCDAGPWGDVWAVLAAGGGDAVRFHLHDLQAVVDGGGLGAAWARCMVEPSTEPAGRVAAFLWLQARAPSKVPVWWDASSSAWAGGMGGRVEQTTGSTLRSPATIARRIADLDRAIDWSRVTVHHGDNREVTPIPGATVYLDPPYAGCPRYAALLPRADVLDLVARWRAVGARVAVSEAVPLDLGGTCRRLDHPKKPEWVSATWPMRMAEQLDLLGAA